MKNSTIIVKFPKHEYMGKCDVISLNKTKQEFITKFPGNNDDLKELLVILGEFYRFGAEYFLGKNLSGEDVANKLKRELGSVTLVDKGLAFTGVWPHSVNFGELCFSSSDELELEITWKYKHIHYEIEE